MSKKKSSDIGMFVIGWLASALAVVVPILVLMVIQKQLPDAYKTYGDKINVLTYLAGAFFSGLLASYRVSCKSDEKDEIISDLESQIDESKKAYNALSPKSKIIGILHEIHTKSSKRNKGEILSLIMAKIGEVNDSPLFDPRYDGMINQIDENQYKENNPTGNTNPGKQLDMTLIPEVELFKKTDGRKT